MSILFFAVQGIEVSSSPQSTDSLEEMFSRLEVTAHDDSTFMSPDTESTASTQSDDLTASEENKRQYLNSFLSACRIPPIVKSWQTWSSSSDRTRQRYTTKSAEMVSAVLKTVIPDDASAGSLWKNLISCPNMSQLLGTETLSPSEQSYLRSLAQAYNNALSWETRRQILSIMSGIASYSTLCEYIPGLTRYRYTAANLHRLQFGTGAEIARQPTHSRMCIDKAQLDHFLDFISSPHLVQDLPFGKKDLKLSTGEIIEVPNVIRSMVPQRIVKQYQQYCKEANFKPFSERTMLRVLSECSASVRKSLQGLDYFAADGAQAFDTLISVVRQLSEFGADSNWEATTIDSLKTAKMYLKGDYKVKVIL